MSEQRVGCGTTCVDGRQIVAAPALSCLRFDPAHVEPAHAGRQILSHVAFQEPLRQDRAPEALLNDVLTGLSTN